MFVMGDNFVNSSALSCRIGGTNTAATFLSAKLALCFVPHTGAAMALGSTPAEGNKGGDISRSLGPRKGDNAAPGAWLGSEDAAGKAFYVEVSAGMLEEF